MVQAVQICEDLRCAEAELDIELRVLEKRQRIAVLRAEQAIIDGNPNGNIREPAFKDIQHSVLFFFGVKNMTLTNGWPTLSVCVIP